MAKPQPTAGTTGATFRATSTYRCSGGGDWIDDPPWLKPSPEGLSILLTSPVLLLRVSWRPGASAPCGLLWLAVVLTAAALFPYFYQGWVQFGYRYPCSTRSPYGIILVALGMAEGRRAAVTLPAAVSPCSSNALGVYWGEKLGW